MRRQKVRIFEFLECFDMGVNIVIFDKESQETLYRGCVVDVPFRVCSQRNLVPDVTVDEGIVDVTVC